MVGSRVWCLGRKQARVLDKERAGLEQSPKAYRKELSNKTEKMGYQILRDCGNSAVCVKLVIVASHLTLLSTLLNIERYAPVWPFTSENKHVHALPSLTVAIE